MEDDPSMVEPRVEFYGLKVPAGTSVHISPQLHNEEGCSVSVHLTQVALGAKQSVGPQTVFAVAGKNEYAIGTLEKGRCEQFNVDYMCTIDVAFKHSGSSDVYLTGYRHISPIMDTIGGPDDYSSEEDELLDDVPALKPLSAKQLRSIPQLQNGGRGLQENVFSSLDDDDEEEDSDDEDEDEDADIDDQALEGEDGDDSAEDDSLGVDEDDSDADVPPLTKGKVPVSAKRGPATAATAEPSAKKTKVALASPMVAAAAPSAAKLAAGAAAAGGSTAGYTKAVREYIVANGATRLSDLGSKVPKPAGVNIKMKKVLDESGLFSIDAKQIVSLKN